MTSPPRNVWNSLEAAKLLAAVLTPALILYFGTRIQSQHRAAEDRRFREAVLQEISRELLRHLANSVLLVRAMENPEDSDELELRLRLHRESQLWWQVNRPSIGVRVNQVVGGDDELAEELAFIIRSDALFAHLDGCVEGARENLRGGGDPGSVLSDCGAGSLIEQQYRCIASVLQKLEVAAAGGQPPTMENASLKEACI